ncbi:MAG: metallophosphoesterase [Syntrophales bacterium]
MKIAATGDIHYDLIRNPAERDKFLNFIRRLEEEKPDVLVLTGDTVGLGSSKLEECLNLFRRVAPIRLTVFGNHEYWSTEGDTLSNLRILKSRIENGGFRLLEEEPVIIGGIGFAGNCLWYDYSFSPALPPPRSSYEKKVFGGHIIWNDVHFVRLGKTDLDYTSELRGKLEADIRTLEASVDQIVAVTHHIGFIEMLTVREEFPGWNFCNAFMGSSSLGEMLLNHPKVRYHICGHTHEQNVIREGSLISINPGSTYDEKRFLSFVIPEDGSNAPLEFDGLEVQL